MPETTTAADELLATWVAEEAAFRARLVGPDGTLCAHATTTCLVFDLPPPRPPA